MSSASPAAPPTPQEINRKLSLHSTRPTKLPKAPQSESDSESIQLPDHVQPSPRTPGPSGILSSPSATHPLSAIAEGKDQSGDEDSEEDDAEGEARQRQLTLAGGLSETVIKSGYLWKKGERRKTWKKRWFVLRSSHLAYYKTDAEYRLLRLLDLSDVHSCLTVTLKKHDNSFGIVAPSRTFYLQAHDQRDAQAWVTAINEQCEKNNQASSLRSSVIDVSGGAGGTTPAPPMITSPSDTTIQAVGGGGAAPPASGGAQPIPIPTRGHVPPPISASAYSPGYGVTSSDSEDASVSPNRSTTVDGRSRSYSRSSAAVPPSPTWPTTVASPPRAQGPATHAEWDPTKMVLSGYLMKCGSKRRHWRKRWFVLTGEKLFYSGSHMDTKPHREIALSQILDALEYDLPSHSRSSAPSGGSHHPPASAFSPSDNTDGPGGPNGTHSFKIVTTKRTLLLCAPTEEEEIRWLSAVRALLARRTSAAAAAVASGDHTAGSEATPQYAQTPTTPGVTAPTTPGGGTGGLLKGKVVRRLSLSSGGQAPPPPPAAAHAPSTAGPTAASKEEEKGGR